MKFDDFFIDGYRLPEPLSKHEVYDLLEKIKQGDERAMEELVEHNIKLVLYQVAGRFKLVEYDKRDLVSIGNVGLMKAIATFDTSKKVEFSTYAIRCIDNEILMFLRKLKKDQNVDSLDRTINVGKDGNELKIEDTLSDEKDMVEDVTDNETYQAIRQIVKELPNRDKKIIMLHFGFYSDKIYTQKEIANMMSISQSYTAKLIAKIVKGIGQQLQEKGVIELRTERQSQKIKPEPNKKGEGKKIARELQTIYEYFSPYAKEQVDEILEKLTEEERALITLKYGEDLNNPISGKLSREEDNKFYRSLIPKMKRMLSNLSKESNPSSEIKSISKEKLKQSSEESDDGIPTDVIEKSQIEIFDGATTRVSPKLQDDNKNLTKEDCEKVLELLRTPTFSQMMSALTVKEAIIISLKFGYVDGKYFSTDSIAKFLGIGIQEVIDTIKKVLLLYKDNVNQLIDCAIKTVTEPPKVNKKIQ